MEISELRHRNRPRLSSSHFFALCYWYPTVLKYHTFCLGRSLPWISMVKMIGSIWSRTTRSTISSYIYGFRDYDNMFCYYSTFRVYWHCAMLVLIYVFQAKEEKGRSRKGSCFRYYWWTHFIILHCRVSCCSVAQFSYSAFWWISQLVWCCFTLHSLLGTKCMWNIDYCYLVEHTLNILPGGSTWFKQRNVIRMGTYRNIYTILL